MRVKLDKIYNRRVETGQEATSERMKAEYQGANDGTHIGLLKAFKIHNEKLMVSAGTLKNYRTRIQNVTAFVNHIYRKDNILLTDVKKGFADDLVHYLLEKGFSVAHAVNHVKALTKVFEMAVNNEWADRNPFRGYKPPKRKPKDIITLVLKSWALWRLISTPWSVTRT